MTLIDTPSGYTYSRDVNDALHDCNVARRNNPDGIYRVVRAHRMYDKDSNYVGLSDFTIPIKEENYDTTTILSNDNM